MTGQAPKKRVRWPFLLAAVIVLVPLVPLCGLLIYESLHDDEYREAKKQVAALQSGMSKDEVTKRVGKPRRAFPLHEGGEIRYFAAPFAAATNPSCAFDSDGRVVRVEY